MSKLPLYGRRLRPSEERYARLLAQVTPWPAETTRVVVRYAGRLARRVLDASAGWHVSPAEMARRVGSVLAPPDSLSRQ